MIQEELTLKHANFLTSENPVEFLGSWADPTSVPKWEHHAGVSSEVLMSSKSLTSFARSQLQDSDFRPEDQKVQCDKVIHQKFRTAMGKLLWMAQLRDDLKHPVEELLRSLSNPQDQDVQNVIRLLRYDNQTRDFVFVMEPQLPIRNQQGKFPIQIVSYSDSGWAGCQSQGNQRVVHWSRYSMSTFT